MTAKEAAWFEAVDQFDVEQMQASLDAGVSVNTLNRNGRTALFYVCAPYGGRPDAVAWLIERGVDVNVRDAKGQSAVDFGFEHVTAALEANKARHNAHLCREAGYVDDVADLKASKRRRKRSR